MHAVIVRIVVENPVVAARLEFDRERVLAAARDHDVVAATAVEELVGTRALQAVIAAGAAHHVELVATRQGDVHRPAVEGRHVDLAVPRVLRLVARVANGDGVDIETAAGGRVQELHLNLVAVALHELARNGELVVAEPVIDVVPHLDLADLAPVDIDRRSGIAAAGHGSEADEDIGSAVGAGRCGIVASGRDARGTGRLDVHEITVAVARHVALGAAVLGLDALALDHGRVDVDRTARTGIDELHRQFVRCVGELELRHGDLEVAEPVLKIVGHGDATDLLAVQVDDGLGGAVIGVGGQANEHILRTGRTAGRRLGSRSGLGGRGGLGLSLRSGCGFGGLGRLRSVAFRCAARRCARAIEATAQIGFGDPALVVGGDEAAFLAFHLIGAAVHLHAFRVQPRAATGVHEVNFDRVVVAGQKRSWYVDRVVAKAVLVLAQAVVDGNFLNEHAVHDDRGLHTRAVRGELHLDGRGSFVTGLRVVVPVDHAFGLLVLDREARLEEVALLSRFPVRRPVPNERAIDPTLVGEGSEERLEQIGLLLLVHRTLLSEARGFGRRTVDAAEAHFREDDLLAVLVGKSLPVIIGRLAADQLG